MVFLIIFLFALVAAIGTGLLSGWSDFTSLTIPNKYPAIIIGLFILAWPAAYFAGNPVFATLPMHLGSGLMVFGATFVLYGIGIIGGGDSKLMSAFAFWMPYSGLVLFLFYTAVLGAVLGIVALVLKHRKPFKNPREGGWIESVQGGQDRVPYGIPIVLGALIAFIRLGYMSRDTLLAFF